MTDLGAVQLIRSQEIHRIRVNECDFFYVEDDSLCRPFYEGLHLLQILRLKATTQPQHQETSVQDLLNPRNHASFAARSVLYTALLMWVRNVACTRLAHKHSKFRAGGECQWCWRPAADLLDMQCGFGERVAPAWIERLVRS